MPRPVLKMLYSKESIAAQIQRLGEEIDRDFGGEEILLIGVLNGAFLFFSDLVRVLSSPALIDFVRAASYGSNFESSGIVELRKDLEVGVAGRNVIIVDDILDTGFTLEFLFHNILARKPRKLKTCVLLDKKGSRKTSFEADYVGMSLDGGFVVGYGLDYQEKYRTLADIYLLQEDQGLQEGDLA